MIDHSAQRRDDFTPIEGLASALDWWRDAGVDCTYADAPQVWLKPPQKDAPEKPRAGASSKKLKNAETLPAEQPIGGDKGSWPTDAAGFRQYWLTEPTLDPGPPERRVAPRGNAGAALMVLVAEPEREDQDHLLAGPQGKLLAAILNAMGIGEQSIYFASVLPRPAPLPDWEGLAARGLAAVTQHHLSLAAPQRLLVFGRALAPLLGIEPAAAREPQMLPIGGLELPVLLAPELAELARSPARRQRFWNRWLEWTAQ